MPTVTAFVMHQDIPQTVQLTVFAQQMLPAEQHGIDIPNAHSYMPMML